MSSRNTRPITEFKLRNPKPNSKITLLMHGPKEKKRGAFLHLHHAVSVKIFGPHTDNLAVHTHDTADPNQIDLRLSQAECSRHISVGDARGKQQGSSW